MAYPLSADVVPGDPTAAAHYNNLRADSLHMGQVPADAVTLGALLERYESRLTIEPLSTDKLRVPASAAVPACLMIDGYMCQAVANVDLADADKPSGGVSTWYAFAVREAASNTFTLSVSTSPTELANTRRIGRFYWDSSKIVRDSIRTDFSIHVKNILYYVDPAVCGGRLAAATTSPIAGFDITASDYVYFTPYLSNNVSLYVQDYGWRIYKFTELSLDITGIANNTNFDVFLYNDAGTLKLTKIDWSTDLIRATLLAWQDGVLVKINDPTYRYLGTCRTSAAGKVADTRLKRFIWNYYNQAPRTFRVYDNTNSWTYNVRTWRMWNNSNANRAQFVVGQRNSHCELFFVATATIATAGNWYGVGVGLDSEIDAEGDSGWGGSTTAQNDILNAHYRGFPTEGFHFLQLLEYAGNSVNTTFYGYNTSGAQTVCKSVASGFVMG